jgi:hypothetical protein
LRGPASTQSYACFLFFSNDTFYLFEAFHTFILTSGDEACVCSTSKTFTVPLNKDPTTEALLFLDNLAIAGIHAMLYTLFPSLSSFPSQSYHLHAQTPRSPIKVTGITTSHTLLALRRRLLLLWRLVRLIRLIPALRRRCLLLLLLLRWRRRIVLRHRRLLRRIHARGALERHPLHLRA